MFVLCTLSSAHRVSQCTARASSSLSVRRAAVCCQLPAVAAANACTEAAANPLLAYEMVQGADVIASSGRQHPPTCLLAHGILGSRRNLKSFAHRRTPKVPSLAAALAATHGSGSPPACSGLPAWPEKR